METDPIIQGVRRSRQEYVQHFGYDLRAVAAELRMHEQLHSERLVSCPRKPAHGKKTA